MTTNLTIQTNIPGLPQAQYSAPTMMHRDLQGICKMRVEPIHREGQPGFKFEFEKANQSKSYYEVYLTPTKPTTMYEVKTLQPGVAKPLVRVEDQTDNGGVRSLFSQRAKAQSDQRFFEVVKIVSYVAAYTFAATVVIALSLCSVKPIIEIIDTCFILTLGRLCSGIMISISEYNREASKKAGDETFCDLIQIHLRVLNLALNLSETGTVANEAYQISKGASFNPLQKVRSTYSS